jgi:amidase
MKNRVHAFDEDQLAAKDAVEIASLIANKEIESKEVVQATINRANKVNPQINAIVTDRFEKALTECNQITEGFFKGIPIFFKDMVSIEGLPAYYGTEARANAKPSKANDPCVKQILAQGFVNLGTSTMPEFGFTCSTEFPDKNDTYNPWNTQYSVGGSSGGAAALVAAGVVPIAHAADGGGSIRIPAACAGLIGLKPSRDRLLYSELLKSQVVKISTDGVVSRSVRDTAHFYAEAEKYYLDKKLPPIGLVDQPNQKKLRIGVISAGLKGQQIDAITRQELDKTIKLLENLGHELVPIKLPFDDSYMDDFINLWAMSGFVTSKFGKLAFGRDYQPEKLTKLTKGLAKHYKGNMFKTPFFVRRLKKTAHTYEAMMEEAKFDLLLSPTLSHRTPLIGHLGLHQEFDVLFPKVSEWACFTPFANATGAPSISLPMGYDQENNTPIGMLFWGTSGRDRLLLELALQIEEAYPWRKIND